MNHTGKAEKRIDSGKKLIRNIYTRLNRHYGDLKWWPGETPFEVIVGAILTQNTSWDNVAKAIDNLKTAKMLCPGKLNNAELPAIAALIRPSGYYNVKAGRLKNFLKFFFEEFGGEIDSMFSLEAGLLREKLLRVSGIGEETADSILLYAGEKPVFVVDAYTKRILKRHGIIEGDPGYREVQDLMTANIPRKTRLYNQYHALIVQAGKDFCRKRPLCERCPLKGLAHA
jgi:endonuclease-3 related protein